MQPLLERILFTCRSTALVAKPVQQDAKVEEYQGQTS
jgi:hypothetical protein